MVRSAACGASRDDAAHRSENHEARLIHSPESLIAICDAPAFWRVARRPRRTCQPGMPRFSTGFSTRNNKAYPQLDRAALDISRFPLNAKAAASGWIWVDLGRPF